MQSPVFHSKNPIHRHTMSTALIIAAGSRGDTEPLVSLSLSLLATAHFQTVHLCLQRDYLHLLPSHPNLIPHPMPFDVGKAFSLFAHLFFKDLVLSVLQRRPPRILPLQNNALALFVKKEIVAYLPALYHLATHIAPDIIIGGILTAVISHSIAEHLAVPVANINFWPLTRTQSYPYLLYDVATARAAADAIIDLRTNSAQNGTTSRLTSDQQQANLVSYETLEHGLHLLSLPNLNAFRAKLGMQPLNPTHLTAIYEATLPGVHVINSYLDELVPRRPQWPASVHSVPALADDYLPPGWNPSQYCPSILKYLSESDDKPFCISFGSMRLMDRASAVTRAIFSAMRKLRFSRILLLTGDMNLGTCRLSRFSSTDRELRRWASEHVYETREPVQYAWLLPLCSGLLCHGGSGTVAAALRAGIPLVVAPVICDQFFWARLLRGVERAGVIEGELRTAGEGQFIEALEFASGEEVIDGAREMAQRIQQGGSGAEVAANLLGRLVK